LEDILKRTVISLVAAAGLFAAAAQAEVVTIYNSISSPLPDHLPSQGYECCQTDAVGNIVTPAAIGTFTSASVVLVDWALQSSYNGTNPAGFTAPITLTLYSVGPNNGNGIPTVGSTIGSVTQSILVPWQPVGGCSDPTQFLGTNSAGVVGCHNGSTSLATFDLTSLNLTVPEQFIYGISYNTDTSGYSPLGFSSPTDSLNVGILAGGTPSVGSDLGTGVYYIADNGNGGNNNGNTFSPGPSGNNNNDLTGYEIEAEFSAATPEPGTFGLIALGIAGFAFARRKRGIV
jgi:hypothetical protein